ncbi:OTU domain-containing protein [Wolbachia endosymbiont of Carposina sasakii]|uniref:hypothetical protein n=1 Tax=Wolbachia endosymbiont of Carposina sasakii TaxID=2591635 RepID=UPI001FECA166|nr:hypothetical protein [Wolbachia endosymbiont of Carposina sasakii]
MKEPNYTREPIALFRQIKEKKKSSNLLHNLKSAYSKKLKIGAALKTGDCFFDSVAQGLNELKPGHRFTAKSLRKDCADYAENKKDSRWVFDEITKNIAEGYAVPMIGSNGNVMKDNQNNIIPDNIASFDRYLKDIRSMATEASLPIWGRPGIEGRMICDKYEVELDIYSIEEDSQKVTVTKITAHDDDLEVFIQGVNLDQLKIDNSKKTVGVVNYMQHFVPLLSGISEDIKEDQQVSSEAILGTGKRVPTSDQSEKEVQQEIININTSAPVLQIYTDKKIPSSHQQEQKTQQKEIQKKLINSYRKEAIYVIATVITAIAFTASAIAAIITQAIPFACLAGTALVAACVCVYQLTQSHKDINELKSELGKGQEDNAHTFLEKVGLKMHDLINKAISKV